MLTGTKNELDKSMFFGGIQKLTLLDYPGKVACTLFTRGCNYRCPFCHNASLVFSKPEDSSVSAREVLAFLKTRQGLLDGVCISGGEPLMHSEIAAFIHEVKALGFLVKLDTNGSFPKEMKALVASGAVNSVAMDVKNTPEKYAASVGLRDCDFSPVEESIEFLLSGAVDYEFRTTVVRELHSEDDLISLARRLSGAQKYFLQQFAASDNMISDGLSGYSDAEMNAFLCKIKGILPSVALRGI